MRSDPDLQVLDVRERPEWEEGHIPGSLHAPYHGIDDVPEGIDPQRPVAAICSSGARSATAASLLKRYGVQAVTHVADGGVGTWETLGYDLDRSESKASEEVRS
jgi:rhodanese-related sulfurtransferase